MYHDYRQTILFVDDLLSLSDYLMVTHTLPVADNSLTKTLVANTATYDITIDIYGVHHCNMLI